ncbi:MAG: 2,3,4,5-tetrahydropyridine-2,6-carboxylate N-succinyltransferase, partial [Deltaproteobacteria bacterium]
MQQIIQQTKSLSGYKPPLAFGIAKAHFSQKNPDEILSLDYMSVNWRENEDAAAVFLHYLHAQGAVDFTSEVVARFSPEFVDFCAKTFGDLTKDPSHKNAHIVGLLNGEDELSVSEQYDKLLKTQREERNAKVVFCAIFDDSAPKSVASAYLKLYAMSLQKVAPRSINLDGVFGLLKNLAWSANEPIELDYLRENEAKLKLNGRYPRIDFIDKFPRFLMHIIPADNTRILDASKVRFGAHIADGTTIMPGASYVNFNAGTLGVSMVEGRISSSAVVGNGSDVGGGASILGVLSGTDGNAI